MTYIGLAKCNIKQTASLGAGFVPTLPLIFGEKDLILSMNRVSSLEVNYGFKKMGRLGLWSSSELGDESLACL